jgi:hypothetical protein
MLLLSTKFKRCFDFVSCNSSKGSGGVAILVRKTCGYKTNELNIENDRICAVKLVKRGYENVCIIGVLLPSSKYEVPYIAPLIFHVVTLINIINITIITQKILRFTIRNRCIVVAL